MSAIRCPNCEKFASLETQDPEVQEINVDEGSVNITVRVFRSCADCSEELKEAYLEMEYELPEEATDHLKEEGEHTFEVEETNVEMLEESGSRYKKSYYGAEVSFTVKCSCGEYEFSDSISDSCAASHMDDMV